LLFLNIRNTIIPFEAVSIKINSLKRFTVSTKKKDQEKELPLCLQPIFLFVSD
jgi:hypothetical protein